MIRLIMIRMGKSTCRILTVIMVQDLEVLFPTEIYTDGKDNDRDGAIDMQDADCSPINLCTSVYIALDCNPTES